MKWQMRADHHIGPHKFINEQLEQQKKKNVKNKKKVIISTHTIIINRNKLMPDATPHQQWSQKTKPKQAFHCVCTTNTVKT